MKKLILCLMTAGALVFGAAVLSAAETTPKSVIHVVTVAWKEDATPAQIQAALDGVKKLAEDFDGITRVWLKSIKVQNAPGTEVKRTHAFVMEFESEEALEEYADSDAQKEWYKVYTPIRQQSTTHDITN
ncbi:MAG: Dabb family protein [Opitutaceae bacterium]